MAVVLQPFIHSTISGVFFSIDPVSGDTLKYVIEYSSQHPSAVVDGMDATRILFNRASRQFEPYLDAEIQHVLFSLVDAAERLIVNYTTPVDIEWCWSTDEHEFLTSQLCLLQCRPAFFKENRPTRLHPEKSILEMISDVMSGNGRT